MALLSARCFTIKNESGSLNLLHQTDCNPNIAFRRLVRCQADECDATNITPPTTSPSQGFSDTHFLTALSFRHINIQHVCLYVLAWHYCLPLLAQSPPHSLDWYHPIATALAVPTLVNKVLIPACWLRLLDILWRLSTHAFLVKRNHTFGDPRFQNGSRTSNNPHHHVLTSFANWHRHQITQRITLVGLHRQDASVLLHRSYATTPMACATRCRMNPLSLIIPHAVSRMLSSAGVGHRFYNYSQPLVGIVECKT